MKVTSGDKDEQYKNFQRAQKWYGDAVSFAMNGKTTELKNHIITYMTAGITSSVDDSNSSANIITIDDVLLEFKSEGKS